MNAENRRNAILTALRGAGKPLSAGALASELGVSRQIIVGDVAVLRASGEEITATPRGYIYTPPSSSPASAARNTLTELFPFCARVACRHTGAQMEQELCIMVDNGCTVLDVIVDHPIYGQLTGTLQLSSRYDIKQFMEKVNGTEAQPLSLLTDGVHLHTLLAREEDALERVRKELQEAGLLFSPEA